VTRRVLNPVNKKRSTKREFHVTNATEYGHFDMDIGKVWIADADVLDDRVWHPHPWIRRINHYKSERSPLFHVLRLTVSNKTGPPDPKISDGALVKVRYRGSQTDQDSYIQATEREHRKSSCLYHQRMAVAATETATFTNWTWSNNKEQAGKGPERTHDAYASQPTARCALCTLPRARAMAHQVLA
jgi:hypothetical protein